MDAPLTAIGSAISNMGAGLLLIASAAVVSAVAYAAVRPSRHSRRRIK